MLREIAARIIAPLMAWWHGRPVTVPALPTVTERYVADAVTTATVAAHPTVKAEDESTRWHLRGQILERLDEYFDCMRRLRRHDRTSYDLFAKTGFAIPSDLYRQGIGAERPAFGGFLMSSDGQSKRILPSFVYFQKMKTTLGVQPAPPGWDVYRITALYDSRVPLRGRVRACAPLVAHLAVSRDGEMRLLKEQTTEYHDVQTTRRNGIKRGRLRMSARRWSYPAMLFDACADVADDHEATMRQTPESFASFLLTLAMGTYSDSTGKIVVRATNGDVTAAFGITIDRAKYFFADREMDAIAADGRRKRIFHAVTRHTRKIAGDRVTEVRAHYRGIRSFEWNSHAITIVLPSNSDVMRAEMPGAVDLDAVDEGERSTYVSMAHAGARFAEVLAS